jgi:hypothetical protein
MSNNTHTNDEGAAAVEDYILHQAIAAKVVKEIKMIKPRNPNKWGKSLVPWFNEECRETRKSMAEAKKLFGKGDERVIQAVKFFHKVCVKGR